MTMMLGIRFNFVPCMVLAACPLEASGWSAGLSLVQLRTEVTVRDSPSSDAPTSLMNVMRENKFRTSKATSFVSIALPAGRRLISNDTHANVPNHAHPNTGLGAQAGVEHLAARVSISSHVGTDKNSSVPGGAAGVAGPADAPETAARPPPANATPGGASAASKGSRGHIVADSDDGALPHVEPLGRGVVLRMHKESKPWHLDIFGTVKVAEAPARKMWSAERNSWILLATFVVAMCMLDYFFFEPLSRRREPVPPDVEAALEKAWKSGAFLCKVMSRRTILLHCQTHPAMAELFRLSPSVESCAQGGEHGKTWELSKDIVRRFDLLGKDLDDPVSLEDLKRFYREEIQPMSKTTFVGHALMLLFWMAVAGAFNVVVWQRFGSEAAWQFSSGYILEWLLSMDNLFAFHLIFQMCRTPRELVHKALFAGIVGALLFRMVAFVALTEVMHMLSWTRFIFGIFLVYSGVMAAMADERDPDVANNFVFVLLKKTFGDRILKRYHSRGAFVFIGGKLHATLLLPVIVSLEVSDILLAVDSVSAKVAQIPDYYLSYSSSIFALFGLRAMFFIIEDFVDMFEMLNYGLCFILVFIGCELIFSDYIEVPAPAVLALIVGVFIVCVGASLLTPKSRSDEVEW